MKVETPAQTADLAKIRNQVEERAALECAGVPANNEPAYDPAPASFVQECLQANELGDGAIFAALHRGRFVYNATSSEWMTWTGHHWERDITGRALAAVENVAARYLGELKGILRHAAQTQNEEQSAALGAQAKRLARRIDRLRTVRGRESCLKFAVTLPDVFDQGV